MTVQELIDKLESIENKDIVIRIVDFEGKEVFWPSLETSVDSIDLG